MITDTTSPAVTINLARQIAYRFLALASSDPKSKRWNDLRQDDFVAAAQSAAEFLGSEPQCVPDALAPGELAPDQLTFTPLIRLLSDPSIDLNAQYERVFGLMVSKKCPPYETEYCPQTFSVYRSQSLADIAGFYRAFGLEPSRDMPERADHISLELDFMAWLIGKEHHATNAEHAAISREAQIRFVRDHLAWWVPAFARALLRESKRKLDPVGSESNFYTKLAANLAALAAIERAVLGLAPPTDLVAPSPVWPLEEMSCQSCDAAACSASSSSIPPPIASLHG